MDEEPPAGPPAVVITWQMLPTICTLACVVFVILALATISHDFEWAMWGGVAGVFAAGALSGYRRRYELSQGQLAVRRVFTRHTIILGELTSVEAVAVTASRGRRFWQLILEDRAGTRVRLSFLHTAPDARREFLVALLPFVAAPGVRLGGPVDQAMAGALWLPVPECRP